MKKVDFFVVNQIIPTVDDDVFELPQLPLASLQTNERKISTERIVY